ncbi:unnamed protein product [Schistocephalus solidus]|uniref:Uncharacterized protein n=1 Tax=Schistocephalus solidus TaxID=70667 RepID=A0A3P7C1H8_SCHSO|nr:unnamed protein product [Schistocephalus solidus]
MGVDNYGLDLAHLIAAATASSPATSAVPGSKLIEEHLAVQTIIRSYQVPLCNKLEPKYMHNAVTPLPVRIFGLIVCCAFHLKFK